MSDIIPLLASDHKHNSTDDMLRAALVFLTNHEVSMGDIPDRHELVQLRDILEELRLRDELLPCRSRGTHQ